MDTIKDLQPDADHRSQRLRKQTMTAHEALDSAITAREPFASRERYGLFLKVQFMFHEGIDALYDDPRLTAALPDLAARRRSSLIRQDMLDLGIEPPATARQRAPLDFASALGWLYVAEGSNLGAAFLLKAAHGLGLSETFGAWHLAAQPEGRGLHWRTFAAALDHAAVEPADEFKVVAGAEAAFRRVAALVDETMGSSTSVSLPPLGEAPPR